VSAVGAAASASVVDAKEFRAVASAVGAGVKEVRAGASEFGYDARVKVARFTFA